MKCLPLWNKFPFFSRERTGAVSSGTSLLLYWGCVGVFTFMASGLFAQNQEISGSWRGELDLGIQKLPLVLHFLALEAMDMALFEIHRFENLNHLFQAAPTGAVSEYGEIEETMHEPMMEKLGTWILQLPPTQALPSP
ncbi:hypothetical protein [Cyclobacterium roseum]|uniref:hypothetical protein n=1 Tax=Cyclobacterium roseum TaxID=2666137 RepID=UPI001390AC96|nr:hypothetical protein [Cyclobacterium roseum]